MKLFATCDRGLEPVLAEELEALGLRGVRAASRGAEFDAEQTALWTANVCSRIASRVLEPLVEGPAPSRRALYDLVAAVPWTRYVGRGQTIAVDAVVAGSAVDNSVFVAQVVKDAVCDRLRADTGGRPSVDRERPDVPIHVRLVGDFAMVALDTSGERLHLRGWRTEAGDAPLRETLAAALLRLTGYDGTQPLLDPFCGSGTFLVEAAQTARGVHPGRARLAPGGAGFAFLRARAHDPSAFALWLAGRDGEARARAGIALPPIVGGDADARVLERARRNATRAGVADDVRVVRRDALDAEPVGVGTLVVTNPPYGDRMGELGALGDLYAAFGDALKRRFAGSTAWLLVGHRDHLARLRLNPQRRVEVYNGPIECRFVRIDLYDGSLRPEAQRARA